MSIDDLLKLEMEELNNILKNMSQEDLEELAKEVRKKVSENMEELKRLRKGLEGSS